MPAKGENMSGFFSWWDMMCSARATIEQDIKLINQLCEDIEKRCDSLEYWCGERVMTDAAQDILYKTPKAIKSILMVIDCVKENAFDKHWDRNGDKC